MIIRLLLFALFTLLFATEKSVEPQYSNPVADQNAIIPTRTRSTAVTLGYSLEDEVKAFTVYLAGVTGLSIAYHRDFSNDLQCSSIPRGNSIFGNMMALTALQIFIAMLMPLSNFKARILSLSVIAPEAALLVAWYCEHLTMSAIEGSDWASSVPYLFSVTPILLFALFLIFKPHQ